MKRFRKDVIEQLCKRHGLVTRDRRGDFGFWSYEIRDPEQPKATALVADCNDQDDLIFHYYSRERRMPGYLPGLRGIYEKATNRISCSLRDKGNEQVWLYRSLDEEERKRVRVARLKTRGKVVFLEPEHEPFARAWLAAYGKEEQIPDPVMRDYLKEHGYLEH